MPDRYGQNGMHSAVSMLRFHWGEYPLVNVNKKRTGKSTHFLAGKIHYFDWAMASIAMLNYQRVSWEL